MRKLDLCLFLALWNWQQKKKNLLAENAENILKKLRTAKILATFKLDF
jgi:hypothetical protein